MVVALSAVLGGTACQDPVASGGGATESPAASPSSTSPAETPVVSEPTPSIEPADGPRIEVPGASMRGLKGYRRVSDFGVVQGWGDRQSDVVLAPNLTLTRSLDAFAKEFTRDLVGTRHATRQPDAVVGGQYSAWVVTSDKHPGLDLRYYGVMYLDAAWTITFSFRDDAEPRPLTVEERQEVIDRILATFETHRETL